MFRNAFLLLLKMARGINSSFKCMKKKIEFESLWASPSKLVIVHTIICYLTNSSCLVYEYLCLSCWYHCGKASAFSCTNFEGAQWQFSDLEFPGVTNHCYSLADIDDNDVTGSNITSPTWWQRKRRCHANSITYILWKDLSCKLR